jgi:hypothetical protein
VAASLAVDRPPGVTDPDPEASATPRTGLIHPGLAPAGSVGFPRAKPVAAAPAPEGPASGRGASTEDAAALRALHDNPLAQAGPCLSLGCRPDGSVDLARMLVDPGPFSASHDAESPHDSRLRAPGSLRHHPQRFLGWLTPAVKSPGRPLL